MIGNDHEKDLISLHETLKDTTESQWIMMLLLDMFCVVTTSRCRIRTGIQGPPYDRTSPDQIQLKKERRLPSAYLHRISNRFILGGRCTNDSAELWSPFSTRLHWLDYDGFTPCFHIRPRFLSFFQSNDHAISPFLLSLKPCIVGTFFKVRGQLLFS